MVITLGMWAPKIGVITAAKCHETYDSFRLHTIQGLAIKFIHCRLASPSMEVLPTPQRFLVPG